MENSSRNILNHSVNNIITTKLLSNNVSYCRFCLKVTQRRLYKKYHNQPHPISCIKCKSQFLSCDDFHNHHCLHFQHIRHSILSNNQSQNEKVKYVVVLLGLDDKNEIHKSDPNHVLWQDSGFETVQKTRRAAPPIDHVAVVSEHSVFTVPTSMDCDARGPFNYFLNEIISIDPIYNLFDVNDSDCTVLSPISTNNDELCGILKKLNIKYKLCFV